MKIAPFELERLQSLYEHEVEINLSESGVEPIALKELIHIRDLEDILALQLAYTQTNGSLGLRAAISTLYPGTTPAHIEVTNGGSEANFITCWSLVETGDEVVIMHPNYLQTHFLAEAFGATVRPWHLRKSSKPEPHWAADIDELRQLVTSKTKVIVICNPNNPTGRRLSASELAAVCEVAGHHGAWLVADEIYRGAELDGNETPSVWGRYERAIITSGLSKAYGLPGLRIGWIVAPPALIETLWTYHDYTTIAPSALGDHLARLALTPANSQRLLSRARRILTTNFGLVQDWISAHRETITLVPPEAGAIAFVHYQHRINSTELATRLRTTKHVLVAPGDHFGLDSYLRIGFGGQTGPLRVGLERLDATLEGVSSHAGH
jgi:aspartate/methionine/tyrosine aminotransferase